VIVVAGGSGVLGGRVVADLETVGCQVRALVRDRSRARAVLGEAVQIVEVDVRRPEGLLEACAGADVVISAFHGFLGGRGAGPREVDLQGNARLLAALPRGAAVVLVSAIGADADSRADLLRAKFAAEQALRTSGVPWSIVRAGPFIETWVAVLRDTARRSGKPLVLGRGERLLAFVSVRDVAAVVVRAAMDAGLRGQVLEVGGEPIRMLELAQAVQRADGRTEQPRHLPRAVLRITAATTRPFNPAFSRKSRMALIMDTHDLGAGDPGLRTRLGLPTATTAGDVLG
jgi:uncharacterized protein YbjT (DUF2867 family)